ncbi:BLUF domain-containing protein [Cerasicoccus frondis]|uniref:BLUF domain-containing protein n=1 Tax=Cerasicoccus frondis TaxID=490090 RepID=UPI00285293B2|nr:BLUF domain-containing protein [Cerasicoccus frondis]
MFSSIVYISDAAYTFDPAGLKELADQSSEKNLRIEVTGYVYYNNNQFMQYMEGPKEALLPLMEQIRQDSRHTVLEEIHDQGRPQRLFPGWNLRWLQERDLQPLNIEHTITDFMGEKAVFSDVSAWEKHVWQMVELMAENQRLIPVKTGPIVSSSLDDLLEAGL